VGTNYHPLLKSVNTTEPYADTGDHSGITPCNNKKQMGFSSRLIFLLVVVAIALAAASGMERMADDVHPCKADITGPDGTALDGIVDKHDLDLVMAHKGKTDYYKGADVNQDGQVDVDDVLQVMKGYNVDCKGHAGHPTGRMPHGPIPAPAPALVPEKAPHADV
jgi:hypothetical protein